MSMDLRKGGNMDRGRGPEVSGLSVRPGLR
jgi:hypothetical protein